MKKLVVDCGATKALWCVSGGRELRTRGFSFRSGQGAEFGRLMDSVAINLGGEIDQVFFYAAGLVGDMPLDLGQWFPGATVECASDMLGAARAVCGHAKGLVAIVGTGANTCQWDGEQIVKKVPSGGYILGDEGSSAVLGRLFVADYLKGLVPAGMADAFQRDFSAGYPALVKAVYADEEPARYLGSLAPLILSFYYNEPYAKDLVDNNFRAFFQRAIRQYDALPLGIVGGFGYTCRDILPGIAAEFGVTISKIEPSPMEGLKAYHGV